MQPGNSRLHPFVSLIALGKSANRFHVYHVHIDHLLMDTVLMRMIKTLVPQQIQAPIPWPKRWPFIYSLNIAFPDFPQITAIPCYGNCSYSLPFSVI